MEDMPTAGDYAVQEARNARAYAEGAAREDAASRAELERQIIVLRGQVAFLTGYVIDLVKGSGEWYLSNDMDMLEKIKENNW
jgi:hypothetical protein